MGRPQKTAPLPSQERLNVLLAYDANTGSLTWKDRDISTFFDVASRKASTLCAHWKSRFAGKGAGKVHQGYGRVTVDGVNYMAHRVAWKIVHGYDPVQIDHINGDTQDNRLENLRDVSHQVNAKNRKLYENNKTGVPGITFHKRDEVWQVRIGVGEGNELHLGTFQTWEEAIAVRIAAETILDYHANHGKRS